VMQRIEVDGSLQKSTLNRNGFISNSYYYDAPSASLCNDVAGTVTHKIMIEFCS